MSLCQNQMFHKSQNKEHFSIYQLLFSYWQSIIPLFQSLNALLQQTKPPTLFQYPLVYIKHTYHKWHLENLEHNACAFVCVFKYESTHIFWQNVLCLNTEIKYYFSSLEYSKTWTSYSVIRTYSQWGLEMTDEFFKCGKVTVKLLIHILPVVKQGGDWKSVLFSTTDFKGLFLKKKKKKDKKPHWI